MQEAKRSQESLQRFHSDSKLYHPASSFVMEKKQILVTLSNPNLYFADQKVETNLGAVTDTLACIATTISPTALKLEWGIRNSSLRNIFCGETWRVERNAWMWVTGMIDTISPLFFTLYPGILAAFGLGAKNPPIFFLAAAEAYMLLHFSYAVQLVMGLLILLGFFSGYDKNSPIIILGHILGTGILAVCNSYFVYSVLATLGPLIDANLDAFEIAQFLTAYFTIYKFIVVIMWYCCFRQICQYDCSNDNQSRAEDYWSHCNGLDARGPGL